MPRPVKPKVFVSYHHECDQAYYDRFAKLFADGYDIITDTSINRIIASDDAPYQQQVIRERHITGSSITVVLCGAESRKRRWIDWEIDMTLNKRHALLGIGLPTCQHRQCVRTFYCVLSRICGQTLVRGVVQACEIGPFPWLYRFESRRIVW